MTLKSCNMQYDNGTSGHTISKGKMENPVGKTWKAGKQRSEIRKGDFH